MSFVPKNPLNIPKIKSDPPTPMNNTRGLFAKEDGWYDINSDGKVQKLISDSEMTNELSKKSEKTEVANVLKGSVIGKKVAISDISPIEHALDIKVRSKNLAYNVEYEDIDYAGGTVISASAVLEGGKVYTISFDTDTTGAKLNLYTFGKPFHAISPSSVIADGTRQKFIVEITSDYVCENDTIVNLDSKATTNSGDCSNFMIEEGTEATEYKEYFADLSEIVLDEYDENGDIIDEHLISPDGTVETINSKYPYMEFGVLDANGAAVVEIKYNRDINKAEQEIREILDSKQDKSSELPYATEEYVDEALAGLINSAPEALNTLNELAKALGNDENFATTVTEKISEIENKLNTRIQYIDLTTLDETLHSPLPDLSSSIDHYGIYKIQWSNSEFAGSPSVALAICCEDYGMTSIYLYHLGEVYQTYIWENDWIKVNCYYTQSEKSKLKDLPNNTQLDEKFTQAFTEQGNDIEFGEELVTFDGWTTEGWTGDLENGFTHTVGQGTPLIFSNLPATGTDLYKVEFDVANTDGYGKDSSTAFTVVLGNSDRFVTYRGGGNFHYCYGIKSVSDGDFRIILANHADPFTDTTTFKGTIKNISIKKVLNSKTTTNVWYDKDGNVSVEARIDQTNKHNTFLGKNAGMNDFDGDRNTAVGSDAMANNTSGFWNTAVGVEALGKNTVGSRNVALGYLALRDNTTGDRNYAFGTFALAANTCGRRNIAIGADALWTNTNGIGNIALGSACMAELTNGHNNIAMGTSAALYTSGSNSVAIGYLAMGNAIKAGSCVAIGKQALYKNEGFNSVAVGINALANNTTGNYNTAIGSGALGQSTTALNSVAIGNNAGAYSNGEGSVFIGAFAGGNATGQNICIGYNAGKSLTTGTGNLIIGRNVNASSATASKELNIGNILFGDLNQGKVGINKQTDLKGRLNVGAGNETIPQMVLWEGALSTTPVAGAVEYNGDGLYFTDKNASRSKLATTEGCVNEVMQALMDRSEIVEFEKTAEGSTITIDNISDTEHNIKCSISGVENLDGVNIIKVGKNLCPNNWEMGYIKSNGTEESSTTYIRTNDYFVLDKSKKYYISAVDVETNPTVTWYFYDKDKVYLSHSTSYFKRTIGASGSGANVGIPNKAVYCKLLVNLVNTNLKAQIEIGTSATEYEEYKGQVCTSNQEGTVEGMTSISPYMHVYSSDSNANIKLDYKVKGRVLPFNI